MWDSQEMSCTVTLNGARDLNDTLFQTLLNFEENSLSKFFSWLLCILTNFWVLRAPKSWLKYFFGHSQMVFSYFQTKKEEKGLKRRKKMSDSGKKSISALGCMQHPKGGQNTQHMISYDQCFIAHVLKLFTAS